PAKETVKEEAAAAPAAKEEASEAPESYAAGTASPAAAKILREKGIDASTIKGTGKDGRITKEDAEKAQAKPAAPQAEAKAAAPAAPATSTVKVAGARNDRSEKMSSLRKTIAKRLVTVKNETAMLTTFNEVN